MIYCNCGDWVESCTALVEKNDGNLELLHWAEITTTLKDAPSQGSLVNPDIAPVNRPGAKAYKISHESMHCHRCLEAPGKRCGRHLSEPGRTAGTDGTRGAVHRSGRIHDRAVSELSHDQAGAVPAPESGKKNSGSSNRKPSISLPKVRWAMQPVLIASGTGCRLPRRSIRSSPSTYACAHRYPCVCLTRT